MGFFDTEHGQYAEDFMMADWDGSQGPLWIDISVYGEGVELKVLDEGAVAFHGLCPLGWSGRFIIRRELIVRASDGTLVQYAMADGYAAAIGEVPGQPYSLKIVP